MSIETFLSDYMRCTEVPPFFVESEVPDETKYVRYRNGVEFDVIPQGDTVYLAFIGTTGQRNRGAGTEALHWLCQMADSHQATLTGHCRRQRTTEDRLNKRRTPGLSDKQLRRWYEKHGFRFDLADSTASKDATPTKTFFYRSPL